jgi:hypothetical protein
MPGCAHGDVGREMRSCPPADLKRMIENWCEKGEAPDFVEPKCRDGTTLRVAGILKKAVKEGDAMDGEAVPARRGAHGQIRSTQAGGKRRPSSRSRGRHAFSSGAKRRRRAKDSKDTSTRCAAAP